MRETIGKLGKIEEIILSFSPGLVTALLASAQWPYLYPSAQFSPYSLDQNFSSNSYESPDKHQKQKYFINISSSQAYHIKIYISIMFDREG